MEMAQAIALGHDIGHAPFGHAGEKKLNELASGVVVSTMKSTVFEYWTT
jgi:dGTPase